MKKLLPYINSEPPEDVRRHPLEDDLDAILRLISWIYFTEDDRPEVRS